MRNGVRPADVPSQEGAAMQLKDVTELWEFIRRDPIGRRLGIAWAIVAWFALTWMSLMVTCVLAALTATLIVMQRKRRDLIVEDDLDDLF